MKSYVIYGCMVLGVVFWAQKSNTIIINWGRMLEALDDGDGGGGYSRGYGYHK